MKIKLELENLSSISTFDGHLQASIFFSVVPLDFIAILPSYTLKRHSFIIRCRLTVNHSQLDISATYTTLFFISHTVKQYLAQKFKNVSKCNEAKNCGIKRKLIYVYFWFVSVYTYLICTLLFPILLVHLKE